MSLYKFIYKTSGERRDILHYEDSVTVQADNEENAWDSLAKFWETQAPFHISSNAESKPLYDVHNRFDIYPLSEEIGVVGYHMSICSSDAFLATLLKPREQNEISCDLGVSQKSFEVLNDLVSDGQIKGIAESFNLSYEEAEQIIEDARGMLGLEGDLLKINLSNLSRRVLNDLVSDSKIKGIVESFDVEWREAEKTIEDARRLLGLN